MEKTNQRAKAKGRWEPSQLETLKLYKDFKDFQIYLLRAIYSKNMPKWLRHSIGERCADAVCFCVECLAVVARTYDKGEKLAHIKLFFKGWDTIYNHICLFHEMKGITRHQRDVILEKRVSIEEQLAAFERSLERSQVSPDQNPKEKVL